MNVPDNIKRLMHRLAALSETTSLLSAEIQTWLENNGVCVDDLRDGSGIGFEELEYGNDITDALCDRIERRTEGKPT